MKIYQTLCYDAEIKLSRKFLALNDYARKSQIN